MYKRSEIANIHVPEEEINWEEELFKDIMTNSSKLKKLQRPQYKGHRTGE